MLQNYWEVNGVTFYAEKDISKLREKIKKDRCLFAFGPWMGELHLELNFWSSFIRFLKKEVYPKDLFICSSIASHKPFYKEIDSFLPINFDYSVCIAKQEGPNVKFEKSITDKELFTSEEIMKEFIDECYKYSKDNNITDVILVVPTTSWKNINLGLWNTYNEYLLSRMDFNEINIRAKTSTLYNRKEKYVCIFPIENSLEEHVWNNIIRYLIDDKKLKVVQLGSENIYQGLDQSLYIYSGGQYSVDHINLVDILSYHSSDFYELIIPIIKNSEYSIVSSINALSLCYWLKNKKILFLAEKNPKCDYNILFNIMNKFYGGLNSIEILFEENINDIKFKDIKNSIDIF